MLHPIRAVTLSRDFKAEAEQIDNIQKTEKFCIEALTWYDMWKHSNELEYVKNQLKTLNMLKTYLKSSIPLFDMHC